MSRTEYDPTPYALAAFAKVALAVQTRAIQRARNVTQAAPEVRVARVEATRRAIHDGTLTLHGQVLAERLLEAVRAERRHA